MCGCPPSPPMRGTIWSGRCMRWDPVRQVRTREEWGGRETRLSPGIASYPVCVGMKLEGGVESEGRRREVDVMVVSHFSVQMRKFPPGTNSNYVSCPQEQFSLPTSSQLLGFQVYLTTFTLHLSTLHHPPSTIHPSHTHTQCATNQLCHLLGLGSWTTLS